MQIGKLPGAEERRGRMDVHCLWVKGFTVENWKYFGAR